tara:strand:+ start:1190 stop:1513 length:324 start_codon:yes stop_codon:yes gene_type:complete
MNIKCKLKKGDKVIVVSGKSKGTIGEILKILPQTNRVLVRGANLVKRHTKPTQNSTGGIIEKENSINLSNIAYYDEKTEKATRLGFKTLENGLKVRYSKKSGEVIDK